MTEFNLKIGTVGRLKATGWVAIGPVHVSVELGEHGGLIIASPTRIEGALAIEITMALRAAALARLTEQFAKEDQMDQQRLERLLEEQQAAQ